MTTLFSHPRRPSDPPSTARPARRPAEAVDLRTPTADWNGIAGQARRLSRQDEAARPDRFELADTRRRVAVRSLDLVVATVATIALLPLMVLIGVVVGVTSRGGPIHVSWRVGRKGRVFPCLKFRTMDRRAPERLPHLLAADPALAAEWRAHRSLTHDPRTTRVGRRLRRSHLDELPQLFNILLGHMSLVGPRPMMPSEIARYREQLPLLLSVRPGLTGPWQVGHRNGDHATRVATEVAYVRRASLAADLRLCLATLGRLVGRRQSGWE